MAQSALQDGAHIPTLATSYIPNIQETPKIADLSSHGSGADWTIVDGWQNSGDQQWSTDGRVSVRTAQLGSTGKGILIGMLSALGSAVLVALLVTIVYFLRYTNRGRILLDRIGRPGEFDDEQQFLREEEEALAQMDDLQRAEYYRAKGGYPPSSRRGFPYGTDRGQHLYKRIHPNRSKRTSPYLNF